MSEPIQVPMTPKLVKAVADMLTEDARSAAHEKGPQAGQARASAGAVVRGIIALAGGDKSIYVRLLEQLADELDPPEGGERE